ncbi:hypothetical protein A9Q98_02460 [Thalassotalea sp. 42_200_T64]|nr:hypothetical protein A9Q98_02460 [Thalassotalea sp. 42_200_T64]
MQLTLAQTINKTCLIGLSYFDTKKNLLKQTMLAGKVSAVDKEMGITVELLANAEKSQNNGKSEHSKPANFILPANLSCWFIAPKGDFHTSQTGVKINNPDYLVTWDIHQTKENPDSNKPADGDQQWWQWQPRTQPPQIG